MKLTFSHFLQAFMKLMLVSAIVHLVVLAFYYMKTQDAVPLNFFSIVGLDLFFPALVTSEYAGVFSIVATVGIYVVLFIFFVHENRRTR